MQFFLGETDHTPKRNTEPLDPVPNKGDARRAFSRRNLPLSPAIINPLFIQIRLRRDRTCDIVSQDEFHLRGGMP
jgi:hypothetical protein